MGKRFERPEDIARERKAADLFISGRADLTLRKLSPHEIDFAISKGGNDVAYLEVKGVKKVSSVYDEHTPIVAIKKLTALQQYVNVKKCDHVYIAWAYADGIKYANIKNLKGTISWGGQRVPREGSTNDHELMFIDNGTEFKILNY